MIVKKDHFWTSIVDNKQVCTMSYDENKNFDFDDSEKRWKKIEMYDGIKCRKIWTIEGNFVSDRMVGLVSAGLMMLHENGLDTSCYFIVVEKDTSNRLIMNNIFSLNKLGNMVGYVEAVFVGVNLTKNYKPDEGTTGIWILNLRKPYYSYWDLLQVDDVYEFMEGFRFMCEQFNVYYRDYILCVPIESEGIPIDDYFDNNP